MMEIKIECSCGQHYKFDVEPQNGQMPYGVQCPTCGVDGTESANASIRQNLARAARQSAPPPLSIRLNPSETPPRTAMIATPENAPARIEPQYRTAAEMRSEPQSTGIRNGLIGALVGAVVGMLGWYLFIWGTGVQLGFVAWGVGGLTGLGARLGASERTRNLGLFAGVFALIAILGGQYLATSTIVNREITKHGTEAYEKQISHAKIAVALTTDDEMKAFIAREEECAPNEITKEQIKLFQEEDMPEYKNFIAGDPSKEDFLKTYRIAFTAVVGGSGGMQMLILKSSFSLYTILWLFLGIGSAYKLGAGSND